MSKLDMEQIVDKLMGNTEWAGETHSDSKALENLATLECLIEHLFNKLVRNVEVLNSHPDNYSANKLADKSKEILRYLKDEIERLAL